MSSGAIRIVPCARSPEDTVHYPTVAQPEVARREQEYPERPGKVLLFT
jgi:hypothetical protein